MAPKVIHQSIFADKENLIQHFIHTVHALTINITNTLIRAMNMFCVHSMVSCTCITCLLCLVLVLKWRIDIGHASTFFNRRVANDSGNLDILN